MCWSSRPMQAPGCWKCLANHSHLSHNALSCPVGRLSMPGFRRLSTLLLAPLLAACQPGATATPTAPSTAAPSPSPTRAPTLTAAPEQTPLPEGAVFRVSGLGGDVGVDFAPDRSLLLVAQSPTGVTAYDT